MQKRIFQASKRGDTKTVHNIQKLFMKSEAARLLAVRRVTQDNQGKKTAGVDGMKSVQPKERFAMAQAIHPKQWRHHKPKPVRRVWIPKPGKAEQRPLGIPTMQERAKQALAKMALEPEWEAVFETNSYGFRPGRSCHDAIDAIFNAIRYKPKYVYDADIKGCFDNIDQEKLLQKLHTFAIMRQVIKGWLKAGVLEGQTFQPTETGTPQGGVISPLLANIALHGMETLVAQGYKPPKEQPILIRYADDFVILHSNERELNQAAQKVTEWLKPRGLALNLKKTRVTHTLTPYQESVGVDFLGFNVHQFPVGKTHTGKDTHQRPLGFKTIISPSKEAIKRHMAKTGDQLKRLKAAPQWAVIKELNPIIWGWTAYYRIGVSGKTFAKCDNILWHQLASWANSRHHNKGNPWKETKYWRRNEEGTKVFATPEGAELRRHMQAKIQRHTKVKGAASPYDGDLIYWSQRLKTHPLMHATKARLLQKQKGKCRWCELIFLEGDIMEIDHIDHNHENNDASNVVLLHRHCHDERHAKNEEAKMQIEKLREAGINLK